MDRPNRLFSSEKYGALDNFCYAEFSAHYSVEKPDHSSEYQPDVFQDKLIKEKHEKYGYPEQTKLMKFQKKMRRHKVR